MSTDLNISFGIQDVTPEQIHQIIADCEKDRPDQFALFLKIRGMMETLFANGEEWMIFLSLAQILEQAHKVNQANGDTHANEKESGEALDS